MCRGTGASALDLGRDVETPVPRGREARKEADEGARAKERGQRVRSVAPFSVRLVQIQEGVKDKICRL